MNYCKIDNCDMTNGEGVRVSLFVSGCHHACEGCFNYTTWDKNSGEAFTKETLEQLKAYLDEDHISGLSLLGGEPLEPYNYPGLVEICKYTKSLGKTVWLWTGYKVEDLEEAQRSFVTCYVDTLIDGTFNKNLPTRKRWRGSDNQRLFKRTLDCTFKLID